MEPAELINTQSKIPYTYTSFITRPLWQKITFGPSHSVAPPTKFKCKMPLTCYPSDKEMGTTTHQLVIADNSLIIDNKSLLLYNVHLDLNIHETSTRSPLNVDFESWMILLNVDFESWMILLELKFRYIITLIFLKQGNVSDITLFATFNKITLNLPGNEFNKIQRALIWLFSRVRNTTWLKCLKNVLSIVVYETSACMKGTFEWYLSNLSMSMKICLFTGYYTKNTSMSYWPW